MIAFMERYSTKWISLAIALGSLTLIAWFLLSSRFQVHNIQLIRDYASPPPLVDEQVIAENAIIFAGLNVFSLNTNDVAGSLHKDPSIQNVSVETTLDGRLVIRIIHRRPVANWITGSRSLLVDETGLVLAEGSDPRLELSIHTLNEPIAKPGSMVSTKVLEVGALLQRELPLMGIPIDKLSYSATSGLTATTHSAVELLIGPPEKLARKLRSLQVVMDETSRRGEKLRKIDLRPLDRPTYQLAG
tara:strand:+ start:5800 stop:6534 length:735 start_codon:yes stop_codon:yes gene_type:complete